jgi:hypothetical protein
MMALFSIFFFICFALGVFGLCYGLFKKFMASNWIANIMGGIFSIVFFVIIFYFVNLFVIEPYSMLNSLFDGPPFYSKRKYFNELLWQTDVNSRPMMYDELSGIIIGKDTTEVAVLLGKPDILKPITWSYALSQSSGFLWSSHLNMVLRLEQGRVVAVRKECVND